jgi:hypothetical protein
MLEGRDTTCMSEVPAEVFNFQMEGARGDRHGYDATSNNAGLITDFRIKSGRRRSPLTTFCGRRGTVKGIITLSYSECNFRLVIHVKLPIFHFLRTVAG